MESRRDNILNEPSKHNLYIKKVVKSCLEYAIAFLGGWRCAFGSCVALLARELKNHQNFKKIKNLSLLPSLQVILPPSLQFWFWKSNL